MLRTEVRKEKGSQEKKVKESSHSVSTARKTRKICGQSLKTAEQKKTMLCPLNPQIDRKHQIRPGSRLQLENFLEQVNLDAVLEEVRERLVLPQ